jgi:hypothetical protein
MMTAAGGLTEPPLSDDPPPTLAHARRGAAGCGEYCEVAEPNTKSMRPKTIGAAVTLIGFDTTLGNISARSGHSFLLLRSAPITPPYLPSGRSEPG